jgi:hypothetical protein
MKWGENKDKRKLNTIYLLLRNKTIIEKKVNILTSSDNTTILTLLNCYICYMYCIYNLFQYTPTCSPPENQIVHLNRL